MMRSNIIMLLLIIFTLCACTANDISNQHYNIPREGWLQDSIMTFTVDIPQNGHYDIDAFVRHNTEYPYSNLWLFINHTHNNSNTITDTLDITLADNYGHWQGNGWGATRQIKQQLLHNHPLDSGTFTITIEQAMRQNCLKGIVNIGISVKKHQD